MFVYILLKFVLNINIFFLMLVFSLYVLSCSFCEQMHAHLVSNTLIWKNKFLIQFMDTITNPRQAKLMEEVRRNGTASIESLAELFGVTLQTVRRDVQKLTDDGHLARFHGGVRLPSSTTENIAYRQRQALNAAGKTAIAKAIAKRIPEGCSLIINIGTTMEAVARELLRHRGLRVITNNLNVAAILSDNPNSEVIVAGGIVRPGDRGIVGEATVDFIKQFKVDIGLIGISGIEADGTLRDYDYREVKVARAIMDHSRQVWLAADHGKFNRPAIVQLAPMQDIDLLFTDAAPPAEFVHIMTQAGVECVVALTSAGDAFENTLPVA